MPIEYQQRVARSFRLLELMLDQTNIYHHHKETMANAGMVTQLTVVAGLFSVATWPPVWVPAVATSCIAVTPRSLSIVAFVCVWMLINVFMRWQLRNRRWAAIFCAALEETLRKWARADPEPEEMDAHAKKDTKPLELWLQTFIDSYFFPCRSATLYSDVSMEGWPNALVVEWQRQAKANLNEPVPAELLLAIGSFVSLVLGLTRLASP